MAYSPSISDIIQVCSFAWTTFTDFRNAPAEFKEIASDCKDVHRVLTQVDEQSKEKWAPMNRDIQSRESMMTCIAKCNGTLQQLNDRLKKYRSLGTAAPKALERVRYITENFSPLRDRLRQDRDQINAQLNIGTNDIVGRIYKAVLEMAEDMKAGRRARTIIADPHDDLEDAWTVVASELQLDDISAEDIATHRSDIEPYIRQLQKEGAFDKDAPSDRDYPDIFPEDSVSQADFQVNSPSVPQKLAAASDQLSISIFRGVPIQEISYRTIFNPNVNAKGFRIPDTFDIWELIRLAWSLQRRCAAGIPGISENHKKALNSMVDFLTKLDPFLSLLLAESSTSKSFWDRFANLGAYYTGTYYAYSQRLGGQEYLTFLDVGRAALETLKSIDEQISQAQSRSQVTRFSEAKPSIFSLRRSKFVAKLTKESAASPTTSFFARKPATFAFCTLGKNKYGLPPGPVEWERYIADDCNAICHFFACAKTLRIPRREFERRLTSIESSWRAKYDKARSMQAPVPASSEEDQSLLLQWLCSAQGLELYTGDILEQMINDLIFAEE